MWQTLVSLGTLLLLLLQHIVQAFLGGATISNRKYNNSKNMALIPSQVLSSSTTSTSVHQFKNKPNGPNNEKHVPLSRSNTQFLIPSQVIHYRAPCTVLRNTVSELQEETSAPHQAAPAKSLEETTNSMEKRSIRSRRRMRPKKKRQQQSEGENSDKPRDLPTTGNLPDPWYRAVSLEHLRLHPQFQPLPKHVTELNSLEDVSRFRQESWQWDALHEGRCTTSQAAGALGFLEPEASEVLGIPRAWRRGGRGAYQRLKKPALRTLPDMKRILLDVATTETMEQDEEATQLWSATSLDDSNQSFVADYHYQPSLEEFQRRKKFLRERSGGDYLERGIRMIWGNTQEATSLLTALNYFAKHVDQGVVLEEAGMYGSGLDTNQTNVESSLLVGATPDGILRYSDGRIEVLEVKNHCPFFSNRGRKRHGGKVKNFSIGDRLIQDQGVFPQYVSQLQMEMLCLGEKCRSAIMVRQTATQGALIIRMHRDDEWIQEMLYFLNRFQREFVEQSKSPPQDFFWSNQDPDKSRYRRFVNRTAELRNRVEQVASICNEDIQRVPGEAPFFLD